MDGMTIGSAGVAQVYAGSAVKSEDLVAVLAAKKGLDVQKSVGAAAVELIKACGDIGQNIDIKA